jgi:hypothetical protein
MKEKIMLHIKNIKSLSVIEYFWISVDIWKNIMDNNIRSKKKKIISDIVLSHIINFKKIIYIRMLMSYWINLYKMFKVLII